MSWEELLDDARASSLAEARSRGRWLHQQAEESATMLGTLVDLAEAGGRVAVRVAGQRRVEGEICLVGIDVVVLRERGERTVVPVAAVEVVRPAPGTVAGPASGDRPAAIDLTVGEVVARLGGGERPEVAVLLRDGQALAGALVAAGLDVLSLRIAPGEDGVAYVSLAAVSSVRFRSG